MIDAHDRSAPRLCAAPGCSEVYRPGVSGPVSRTHSETCSRRLRRHEARGRGRLYTAAEHLRPTLLDGVGEGDALAAALAVGEPLARLEEFLRMWREAADHAIALDATFPGTVGPALDATGIAPDAAEDYVAPDPRYLRERDGSITDLAALLSEVPGASGGRSTPTESGEDGDGPAGRPDVRPGRRAVGERLDFGELHPDLADGLSFEGDGDPGRCPCLDCPHDPACPCAPELARPAEVRGACVHDPYCPCAARFCEHPRPLDPRRGSFWEDHGETCPEFR